MKNNDAIINPMCLRHLPDSGDLGIMVSSNIDLKPLCSQMNVNPVYAALMMSRMYSENIALPSFSITGPITGAPYAVMVMETLAACGIKEILYFGWCGSVNSDIKIGDIFIPSGAIIDEGTSLGYDASLQETVYPSEQVNEKIKTILTHMKLDFSQGIIWSTDAIYRETREKVESFQSKNAAAVEMELSALFNLGKFRGVNVGAVLVVSDELGSFKWKPGFKDIKFKQTRAAIIEVIKEYVKKFRPACTTD